MRGKRKGKVEASTKKKGTRHKEGQGKGGKGGRKKW